MRRERILLILGIWVAILPYLGFPYSWKRILFTLSGMGLVYISYSIYHENKKVVKKEEEVFDNFSENKDWSENTPMQEDTNTN